MSYQEKRNIVSMITGALVLAAYCIYAFGKYQSGAVVPGDIKFWAVTMLIFIGIGVGASIVIQIIFHILLSIGVAVRKKLQDENYDDKEIEKSIQVEMVEDEMGKLIELKSLQVGFFVAGIGFIGSLVALVMGYSAAVMLNITFISFSLAMLVEGFAQLYFYRRGIRHA